jgi:predicted NBD/HSP70 family sugar kinase
MARADGPYAIGVRINPGKLVGVIVDLDGAMVPLRATAAEPVLARTLPDTEPDTVARGVAILAEDLLTVRSDLREHVVGLGAAVGGHVHGDIGEVHRSPNLGWTNTVPLGRLLADATGLEADLENDANALAIAEQLFGQGVEYDSFAVVRVRAGVSCGLVLSHELYTGAKGLAGELGHFFVESNGVECRCGNEGCLETIASRDAMLRAVRATGRPEVATIDQLAALARAGDKVARTAIEGAGEMLGRGLSMLLNLLNLEVVLLYAEESLLTTDAYLRSVHRSLRRHAFSSAVSDCRIFAKVLTDTLEARGAASMAFRHLAG